jgi:hypothetical protein
MSTNVMTDIIQHIVLDKTSQSRLIELYFLANDPDVGDLTWKIAGLPPPKRDLLRRLLEFLSEGDLGPSATAMQG